MFYYVEYCTDRTTSPIFAKGRSDGESYVNLKQYSLLAMHPRCFRRYFMGYVLVLLLHLLLSTREAQGGLLYSRERVQNGQLNSTIVDYMEAIVNSQEANLSHSYDLITRLPLKNFEFKYDAVLGRTQLGLVGPDIKEFLPESVQILPQRIVVDRDKQRIMLQNFHSVDKDAVFMHNVAATQVLIRDSQSQQSEVLRLVETVNAQEARIVELQAYLEQEASVQLVQKRKIVEAEVERAEKMILEAQARGEVERLTLELKKQTEMDIETSKHDLARKRLEEEDEHRKAQNRDLVSLQEAMSERIEMKRRETEEVLKEKQLAADHQRALLERNTTLEKAAIDVEGRIRQQRMNQDIEMAQLQQRLEADRVKLMQALQATFDNIGQGATVLLSDKEKLTKFVGGFVALAAGIYLSREAIRIIGNLIEQRLGKPSLVRETSRTSGLWGFFRSLLSFMHKTGKGNAELADVVLRATLETRVFELAKSTRNAKLHRAPYRHLLLYGPPGTGKTMVAKRLARCSGMDYAILSGGDVGPLGSDAVTELHALFRWANSSPRGVLIFIDEAEAFLGCRATRKTHMSEAMRNALNALLYHTGTQSKHFMLVIATNRPEDLDTAVTDRIDDTLHFDLPELSERVRLLEMYFNEYVSHLLGSDDGELVKTNDSSKTNKKTTKRSPEVAAKGATSGSTSRRVDSSIMQQYGARTEGMSGREIAKMLLYMQSIVYAQDKMVVTPQLVERVVNEKIEEHKRKQDLRNYKDN